MEGWTALTSFYAVAATSFEDVVAAVNFGREQNIRLVVKGTGWSGSTYLFPNPQGHDYYGRSSAPDSLQIWTHHMRDLQFLDSFTPSGCTGNYKAVKLGPGLTWMDVYAQATDRNLVT